MDDIEVETWVTIAIRINVIKVTILLICDRITIRHREGIHQVLSWIDATLSVECRREIVLLLDNTEVIIFLTLIDITTPNDFSRNSTRLQLLDFILIRVPGVTVGSHT